MDISDYELGVAQGRKDVSNLRTHIEQLQKHCDFQADTIQQQAERIRELEAVVSGFARDIEKCVEACVRAGIGDEHSPEGAVDTLAWQLAEVVEYATRLRGEIENLQKVKGRHNSEIACGRLFDTLALPLPKAMQGEKDD